LPKVVVEDIGGTRTDAGMLGYGIYFADLARLFILLELICNIHCCAQLKLCYAVLFFPRRLCFAVVSLLLH